MSERIGLSYAVIKNLRRRSENSAATLDSSDPAGDVETSSSLWTSGPNDGDQISTSALSSASTASPESPLGLNKKFYSASKPEDDFDIFFTDPPTPQTLPSLTTSVCDSTDVNDWTSTIDSDSRCTTLIPTSAEHTRNCNNATTPSAEDHIPDGMDNNFVSSLPLEDLLAMESGFTNDARNDSQYEMLWELPNDSLADTWTSAAVVGLTTDTASYPTIPLSINSALVTGQVKRVSLVLEDMQPEMANRVATLLLNSNMNVKMKMTVQ